MMTFIVVACFVETARLLIGQHLRKQRLEAKQLIEIITQWEIYYAGRGPAPVGHRNHPTVKMWTHYLPALMYYYNCMVQEHIRRGGKNTMELYTITQEIVIPWFVHWPAMIQSHRAMLCRKHPGWYDGRFDVWPSAMQYGYIWPDDKTPELIQYGSMDQLCEPIPSYLAQPVYCMYVNKSGEHAGKTCGWAIQDDAGEEAKKRQRCGKHARFL